MGKFRIDQDIEADINKLVNSLIRGVTEEAEKDLIKAFDKIVDNFYGAYDKKSYRRKNGLHSAINHKSTTSGTTTNKLGIANVKVSSSDMEEHYRTSASNVLDLMWIHGIRGLPKVGGSAISHDFTWFTPNGIKHWKAGEQWTNPFWNPGEYGNVFKTSLPEYTSASGTPNQVMTGVVLDWGRLRGKEACDKIAKTLI